jgi:hypothetical protein
MSEHGIVIIPNRHPVTMQDQKTRFVLVGLGRCGSNLLKFALKQNPDIAMVGELFNRHVYPEALEQDGATRASDFFTSQGYLAVGFKLFRHQGRRGLPQTVWDYLAKDKNVRIIHLSRKNYFKRVLSWKIADKRGQWLADKQGTEDIQIDMPPTEWQQLLELDGKKEAFLDRTFKGHPTYKLSYEGLIANWEEHTRLLQEFLRVPVVPLQKSLQKQESKHPCERCPNYEALKVHFKDTPYGWMFG